MASQGGREKVNQGEQWQGGKCKRTDGPVGKVGGRKEVHRGGSAHYKLRGEEDTLKGLHHIKMQHKKPKSGADLGASICT